MELVLVRHGQSTANAEGIWQGKLDFPLSDAGREQARMAGRAMDGASLDAVYASPLSRAFETASIIAGESGFVGDVKPVEGLIERGGGRLEGSTWEERDRSMPGLMEKFRSVPEEEGWTIVGAETDEEILTRFASAIEEITLSHDDDSKVLVVTHGGVMRAYLRDVFGPDVLSGGARAQNASITRISLGNGSAELLELATTSHLEGLDSGARETSGQPISE